MRNSVKTGIFSSTLALVLLLPGTAAFSQDNATITGDSVNLRAEPSRDSEILESLKKGARVEVQAQTDVSATVEGYTADWFIVNHKGNTGFVFGRYIKLDFGVTVPLQPTGPQDPVGRLVAGALGRFGQTEAEITGTLGRPMNVTETPVTNPHWPEKTDTIRELNYAGLVIGIYRVYDGKSFVYSMTVTDARYKFDGIGVGSSMNTVTRLLGSPVDVEGDTRLYQDREIGIYSARLTMRNGVVTEIRFFAID